MRLPSGTRLWRSLLLFLPSSLPPSLRMFYRLNPLRPLGRIVEYATFFLTPLPCGSGLLPAPSFALGATSASTLSFHFTLTLITLLPVLFSCTMGGWWRVVGVVAGRARRPCCLC